MNAAGDRMQAGAAHRDGAPHGRVPDDGRPFLAADVGGTHARIARVRARGDGDIEVLAFRNYVCADFPGLAAIVADFLAGTAPVDDVAIGCAGLRRGDSVISLNLPWPVSLADIRALGPARVATVNDFVAVAHAEQCMRPDRGVALTPADGDADAPPGPVLVVGPGTGFGAALRVPVGDRWLVLGSEAGQVSLAPGTARERAVLAAMQGDAGYVTVQRIVSGPGLLGTYRTLCALDGVAARAGTPGEVAAAAADEGDAQAAEAVAMFCAQFGSLLADLVLVTNATRACVAGGIVARILPLLARSAFVARFLDKGGMRPLLEQVPVRLVDDPHAGVIGAARWYLERDAGPDAPGAGLARDAG